MKRTKNMYYTESHEARELFLFAANAQEIYNRTVSIIENLRKKAQKGAYDPDKAVDAWYHLSNEASKLYFKWYGFGFTVTERFTAAVELEKYYRDDMFNF